MTYKNGYACDFETYPSCEKTWVWAWGACSIDNPDIFHYGDHIGSFFEWVLTQKKVYFHNLKFDGAFICLELFRQGYAYTHGTPKVGEFTTIISSGGQWYKIYIKSKHGNTSIYDSYKKLPFSIETIAKNFKLPLLKGSIDYNLYRPEGHAITDDELSYLRNDCEILARALKIQLNQGLRKMTIGSDALSSYKNMLGNLYKYHYPKLNPEVDYDIRRAYKGGWVYLNKPGEHGETICLDVNSLYPYAMTMELPYGFPVFFEGEYKANDDYPLYVINIDCDFVLKEKHLPTIQLKGGNNRFFVETEYIKDSKGIRNLTLTSVDFELFKNHYDILEIHYNNGYMFKSKKGMFDDYISYWMHIKETTTGALRELAKLMLNSLYGKFAKNPDTTRKTVSVDNDTLVLKTGEAETGATEYIPLGVFITANARWVEITTAQKNYDRFIYGDTDSNHLTGTEPPEWMELDSKKLGCWDHEYTSERSRFIRAKRYITYPYKDKGFHTRRKVTCAGLPSSLHYKVTWKNFVEGTTYYGKLTPKNVPGGTYLHETYFTLG